MQLKESGTMDILLTKGNFVFNRICEADCSLDSLLVSFLYFKIKAQASAIHLFSLLLYSRFNVS